MFRGKRQFEVIEGGQMEQVRAFHDVARALTSKLDLQTILRTIMDKMAQFFGPERWSLLMVDEKAHELYYEISIGENEDSLRGLRIPIGQGVSGWVAESGESLIIPDVRLDPYWSAYASSNPDLNIQSLACVPIQSDGKVLGVIQLHNTKLDLMSQYSISFLRILCDYAAIAIKNARSMQLIQELSITDDCTGLFNARHLYNVLEEQTSKGRLTPFSLLFMDMDHFKSVNDTYGHLVGSRLLAEVGNLLQSTLGHHNPCFRYGGDEFVAVLPGISKAESTTMARKLYTSLREARFLTSHNLSLQQRGSMGLATFPEDGDSVHAIIKSADTMMYEVKSNSRDNLAVAGIGLLYEKKPNIPRERYPSTRDRDSNDDQAKAGDAPGV